MGLSSKQVSIDGFDWSKALLQTQKIDLPKLPNSGGGMKRSQLPPQNQNQNQSPELLKCPRCDSTNTKFCYYNNYNKSQPRHFCRTCKRHWTKGGTLRNVPVGGGRKNKRFKKSTTSSANAGATTKSNIDNVLNSQMSVQVQIPKQNLAQKNVSDVFYQELVFPQSLQNFKGGGGCGSGNWQECENFFSDYGILNTQMSIQSQNPNFSAAISSSTSFEAKQSPISTSNNICNYSDFKPLEIDPTITTPINTHQWQPPTATAEIPSCYWSWDEIDTFTATDLNIPWDDKDIKP